MKEDPSREFDMFEGARRRLARVFEGQGHDPLEAERAALYVVQGVREVPRLLNALAGGNAPDHEIRPLLELVLDNAALLDKARLLMLGGDEQPVH